MAETNQIQKAPEPKTIALDKPAPSAKAIIDIMSSSTMVQRFAAVATKHLTPEKLIKMIGVQMQRVPKLGQCTPMSVFECAMTLAELGLTPGILGDAYLIPYQQTCTVIIGYRGLIKLARRSGTIATLQAEVVREGDQFNWRLGAEPTLEHVPTAEADAPITHAWALAKFKDGSVQFTVMRKTEVDAIRRRSKASGAGPWVTDYNEMAKKTAIRRLCKMLPLSAEVEQQIEIADRTEFEYEDFARLPQKREQPTAGHIADEIGKQMADLEQTKEDAQEAAEGDEDQTQPEADLEGQETPEESQEAQERREKLKEQAEKQKAKEGKTPKPGPVGCDPSQPGCSKDPADYSTIGNRRICANHARKAQDDDEGEGQDLLGTTHTGGTTGRRTRK